MDADQKKSEMQRELLFQKRIAELGFQRQRLPWNMAEAPQFNLPFEETKYAAELELEDEQLTSEDTERRVLMDLISQTYNFRQFYKRLHYELKRATRYKRALSLLLVGIDRLDLIEQQFGVAACDSLIQSAAKILMSSIRDVDLPGRCRADVFGVILPETAMEGAEVAAERIRTKLEQHTITYNWHSVTMTASVGVSSYPSTAQGLDELFAQAAEAVSHCMLHGGNSVRFAPAR